MMESREDMRQTPGEALRGKRCLGARERKGSGQTELRRSEPMLESEELMLRNEESTLKDGETTLESGGLDGLPIPQEIITILGD